jgi:uncharacterized protein YjiS (DUF1127 family)
MDASASEVSMTDQAHAYPRLQPLIDALAGWLQHRRALGELRQMDQETVNRIAGDLRISSGDLDELVRNGPHAADELPKMLEALGVDEAALARSEPLVLRDMERVCALCKDKSRCHDDLAAGTAKTHYEDYCLNAPTIGSLGDKVASHA